MDTRAGAHIARGLTSAADSKMRFESLPKGRSGVGVALPSPCCFWSCSASTASPGLVHGDAAAVEARLQHILASQHMHCHVTRHIA